MQMVEPRAQLGIGVDLGSPEGDRAGPDRPAVTPGPEGVAARPRAPEKIGAGCADPEALAGASPRGSVGAVGPPSAPALLVQDRAPERLGGDGERRRERLEERVRQGVQLLIGERAELSLERGCGERE